MSQFRISLGNASIENLDKNDIFSNKICNVIIEKISNYKNMEFSKLKNLIEQNAVEFNIDGKEVALTFYKKEIDQENLLLVVQAAYRTLRHPNYFSFGFIGKIIVEGIVVNAQNEFTKPDERLLWEFK